MSIKLTALVIILSVFFQSCKKSWLDAKPEKGLVVPSTIKDFQSLMDNTTNSSGVSFNGRHNIIDEIAAGDFYITDDQYNNLLTSITEKANYIWAPDIYGNNTTSIEWNLPYERIFYTNIILEGMDKIIPANSNEQVNWNQVKGSALFFRAYNHYSIANLFCKAYDGTSANTDLGIPLKLESDINIPSVRSTVQETYDQILKDLKEGASLIEVEKPSNSNIQSKTRPNKAAAFAMIARVYLAMSKYDSARVYADKSLQLYNTLLDFNDVTSSVSPTNFSLPSFYDNDEVLFYDQANSYIIFNRAVLIVDSFLMALYDHIHDARVIGYGTGGNAGLLGLFQKTPSGGVTRFLGSYARANNILFTGLATDEMYLIRAEYYARMGDTTSALNDLNTLYEKRWRNTTGQFERITATDVNDALRKVLIERRKELCFRGLRWSDLKRLNKDPQFRVDLKRIMNGQTYNLPYNSDLYVFPLPPDVIQLSGIQQNPR